LKTRFPLIFLLVFFLSLWTTAMDEAAARTLPDKLLRLRVVARTDSPKDQADKLLVRDTVLDVLSPLLADCADLTEAEEVTAEALPLLAQAAGEALRTAGTETSVSLRLGDADCPPRDYGAFALPAGAYQSLTVTLGDGKGHNWWCVVFPPLCLAAAGEDGEEDSWAVFSPGERRLMKSQGVELRFRVLELVRSLRRLFSS